jgi:hypothetical protein
MMSQEQRTIHQNQLLRRLVIGAVLLLVVGLPSIGAASPPADNLAQAGTDVYQNDDPEVLYNAGEWVYFVNSQASGGSFDYTEDEAAEVEFNFSGSTVTFYYTKGPTRAKLQLQVDDRPPVVLDGYSASLQYAVAYRVAGLNPDTAHTITVTHAGERNAAATGNFIDVDAFEVADPTPIAPGRYENTAPELLFDGNWKVLSNTSASGGSVHYSNNVGDRLSVLFNRTNAFEVGYMKAPWGGNFDVIVDGITIDTIDTYAASVQHQHTALFTGINDENAHTLEIVVTIWQLHLHRLARPH